MLSSFFLFSKSNVPGRCVAARRPSWQPGSPAQQSGTAQPGANNIQFFLPRLAVAFLPVCVYVCGGVNGRLRGSWTTRQTKWRGGQLSAQFCPSNLCWASENFSKLSSAPHCDVDSDKTCAPSWAPPCGSGTRNPCGWGGVPPKMNPSGFDLEEWMQTPE